jgi:molybdopterin/thiamine biosynthesis adenylyltransferase
MVNVIGAGGVGTYLLPCLTKTTLDVTIWDGDVFEEKNHERQIFDEVGVNKATHLAEKYGVKAEPKYFSMLSELDGDIILCCVDNDATRLDVLEYADINGIPVIIGANETYCAEAYIYYPMWKGTKLDPRVYYEYNRDNGHDPRNPPCNGIDAIEENPQLPLANMSAATLMLKLLEYHTNDWHRLKPEDKSFAPFMHQINRARLTTISIGEAND